MMGNQGRGPIPRIEASTRPDDAGIDPLPLAAHIASKVATMHKAAQHADPWMMGLYMVSRRLRQFLRLWGRHLLDAALSFTLLSTRRETMIRTTLRALMALLTFTLSSHALAQTSNNEAEQKSAFEAANKVHIAGPANVPVRDQAVLNLPKGYLFVPTPEATRLLKSMGNTIGNDLAGVVFPADEAAWFAVIRYVSEGHIKDDDAKEWNADELLSSLREGTEAANAERAKLGIKPMEVIGWTEKPRYEATSHRLVWSASTREKGTSGTTGLGVNYNTYSLGREGYISLNLVTELDQLGKHKPAALELLGALQFNEGRRYADFNSSTDKVAAYGLAALVAGAAAKKLGLFALILAFVAKFAKVFIVAGGAAVWGVFKLFGKKKEAQPPAVESTSDAAAGKPPGAT